MAVLPREPGLNKEQRHALALLASTPHGITEDLLALAHGFDRTMIARLVDTGLATAQREIVSGRTTIEVVRIRMRAGGRLNADRPAANKPPGKSYIRPPRRTGIPIPAMVLVHTRRSGLTLNVEQTVSCVA
jgi:hypothetical protein